MCTHDWPVDNLSGLEEWRDMHAFKTCRAHMSHLNAGGLIVAHMSLDQIHFIGHEAVRATTNCQVGWWGYVERVIGV